ncbi:unnamed protein product [Prorocentrum cordatum]|uniref:Uncharacterized protein n=1 Tax=Prorocentrum cordatum TaxID=2364126 RepID=A0ABN9RIT4_9DINO|nr:unnamed protein product [Polarella glacialis]
MYKWAYPGNDASRNSPRAQHIVNVMNQMRHQNDCAELIESHEARTSGTYDIEGARQFYRRATSGARDVFVGPGGYHQALLLLVGIPRQSHGSPRRLLNRSIGATYSIMEEVVNSAKLDDGL